jgi:hypothetical protein
MYAANPTDNLVYKSYMYGAYICPYKPDISFPYFSINVYAYILLGRPRIMHVIFHPKKYLFG